MLHLEGGVPTRLTFDRGQVVEPVWSGDGHQIYFGFTPAIDSADETAGLDETQFRSMRVAADGSSVPTVITEAAGYYVASIAPDGSFLVVGRENPETSWDLWVFREAGRSGSPDCVEPPRTGRNTTSTCAGGDS